MNVPLLKNHWERYQAHFDISESMMMALVSPFSSSIVSATLLSEGCANTNYKVDLADGRSVVLRIYLREHNALDRELGLCNLIQTKLPIPQIYYHDARCQLIEHPYAIVEYIEGELMRQVILSQPSSSADCAFAAGTVLNQLKKITLAHGGFFQDRQLTIRPFNPEEEYTAYAFNCLDQDNVQESLGKEQSKRIKAFIKTNQSYLPSEQEVNLTHADFDPANMLVKKVDGHYQLAALLDWEFAFAGTYLLDMGMFLRYSHRLPKAYESQFIRAFDDLPDNWKKSAKLMDLICLLSLLFWNNKTDRPNLTSDVAGLIENTLDCWNTY